MGSAATDAAKSLQLCPTLCDPIDSSPPGSPIPGIPQARTLEWAAISFSNTWKWRVKVKSLSHVRLLATPWTAAHQAPPFIGFSRQEYWSGVPLPSPRVGSEGHPIHTYYCHSIHTHIQEVKSGYLKFISSCCMFKAYSYLLNQSIIHWYFVS